jgi:hypothetical protein
MTPTGYRPGSGSPDPQTVPVAAELPTSLRWKKVEARWETLRPKVAAYWPRLPADEVKRLTGDLPSLIQLIRKNYGIEENGAEGQVNAWLASLSPENSGSDVLPPPARTKDEQRAEGEGMGSVPGAASTPDE